MLEADDLRRWGADCVDVEVRSPRSRVVDNSDPDAWGRRRGLLPVGAFDTEPGATSHEPHAAARHDHSRGASCGCGRRAVGIYFRQRRCEVRDCRRPRVSLDTRRPLDPLNALVALRPRRALEPLNALVARRSSEPLDPLNSLVALRPRWALLAVQRRDCSLGDLRLRYGPILDLSRSDAVLGQARGGVGSPAQRDEQGNQGDDECRTQPGRTPPHGFISKPHRSLKYREPTPRGADLTRGLAPNTGPAAQGSFRNTGLAHCRSTECRHFVLGLAGHDHRRMAASPRRLKLCGRGRPVWRRVSDAFVQLPGRWNLGAHRCAS
jgi:hypothetical protein